MSNANQFELRYAGEIKVDLSVDRKIRGTAIVFNSLSRDLGGFREIIQPEAVDRIIREAQDIRALVNHDTSKVLGRTRSGTLQLRKTRRGLEVEIDPPNTTAGRDILESLERGDVSGMSFRFVALSDDWRMQDGQPVRYVDDMDVDEVSVVTFPAYEATDVGLRSDVALRSLQAFKAQQANKLDFLARELQMKRAR